MDKKPKVFVLSRSSPPRSGGTPSIIANQLSWMDYYFIFMGQYPTQHEILNNLRDGWLFYGIPPIRSQYRFLSFTKWLWIILIALKGFQVIRKNDCKAIILWLFDNQYMASGLLLSYITRLPLILYVTDFWADVPPERFSDFDRATATWLEGRLFRRASYRVTNIPDMVSFFTRKYGKEVCLVPNCYPQGCMPLKPTFISKYNRPYRIGFSGSIYFHNLERIKVLCDAIERLGDVEIILFTSQSRDQIRHLGLNPELFHYRFEQDRRALLDALSQCDVLYLPISLNLKGNQKLIAEVAFPSKVLDYLGAGRPILLSCPPNSYLEKFFKANNAAEIVTDSSVDALCSALIKLRDNHVYSLGLTEASYPMALDFIGPKPMQVFDNIIKNAVSKEF